MDFSNGPIWARTARPNRHRGHLSKPHNRSRENGSTSSIPLPFSSDRGLTQSPAELRVANKAEVASSHPATIYPELDRYRHVQPPSGIAGNQSGRQHPDFLFRLATEGLPPPPTPYSSGPSSLASGISGSPSTRFSESPGPGSYSRDTTPTSMSSYSPGVVTSTRTLAASKVRQNSRGRAGSFGTEVAGDIGGCAGTSAHPLSAIRESLNSSSSSSNGTVRDGDKKSTRPKKKRLSPLPPSPPPRKSSQGFRMPTDTDKVSLAKPTLQERPTVAPRPSVSSQIRKPAKATASSNPTSLPKPPPSGKSQIATASRPVPSRSATQPAPPTRPSRDGTPDLHSHFRFPIPVIHSSLATARSSDRRGSIGMALSSQTSTTLAKRHQRSTSILSFRDQRAQSPARPPTIRDRTANRSSMSISGAVPGPNSASGSANVSVRVARQDSRLSDSEDTGRKTRTPSPSVSTFRTRFPLFGRRTKPALVVNVTAAAEPKEKPPRRGPAAGTGHEGYGRLGASRRRSNSAGTLSRGVSASQDNQGNAQVQDPFLRDRLSPVIISGGEVVLNKNTSLELSRTDSNTSFSFSRPSLDLPNTSQVSLSSSEDRSALWPSAMSRDGRLASSPQLSNHRPSDSSDSEVLIRPTLAFRRSVQLLHAPSESQIHLPAPIVTRESPPGVSSSVTSLDTGILSDDSTIGSRSVIERGLKESVPVNVKAAPKKLTKRARSPRKWNMFGRSQSQPASLKKRAESSSTVTVTVEAASSVREKKPVAFYTMIDSSEQEDGDTDMEHVLREAHALQSPTPKPLDEQTGLVLENSTVSKEDLLLPPPPPPLISILPEQQMVPHEDQTIQQPQPQLISSPQAPSEHGSPSTFLQTSTAQSERPSRLQQVGRIPKVVSARQEQSSPWSFSRPFNRASIQVPASLEIIPRAISAKDTPLLESSLQVNPASDSTEFLAFPPRHNSGTTTTSRSSGVLTFADSTAIVPDPSAPLYEDEVWDEYDDLLGEDETAKIPLSPSSSHGLPFHLEGSVPLSVKAIARQIKLEDEGLESPTVVIHPRTEVAGEVTRQYARPTITSSVWGFDMAAQLHEAINGWGEPPSGQLPPTPFSVSEFVSGYGDRSSGLNEEDKAAGPRRSSVSSERSGPQKPRNSDGSVYSQVSEDNSPTAQVNLRVGSMTVSKWLTFGHVLFSPARDDMVPAVSPPNGHSVLVVDGLGNDDWSFYAAETYPAATFFNMSPRAPLPAGHGNGATTFPMSPSNHHQIQYMSHADKFPFASEIFTTVVYRFPRAAPESHYRNIISEARRVLQPGGYIELSILDLDMNNMGSRTRRAVRQMKEQIHLQTPDVHLGSAADAILRLLGSKGYTDIKSCRVGVPAAKAIPRSSSEISVNGTARPRSAGKRKKDNRSLSEMISDQSPVADESITNMVARVGRWWHGKCYGDIAAAAKSPSGSIDSNGSVKTDMWTDRAVLAECEAWGTNLKLMACYARVPDTKRVASI
ncbi:hypothetical protein CMQ_6219 [Grosmannia clavigera kw1407]|uniref:Methyltransferase type 11 domain-containing protein n=1 Tax=Grosmannia clavigera (strain kw1407 / UAMH 11150) TaxID=655863 RepID=F0XMD9_GROCL|nr:uncharacterized protein CMQ_6219 [Grosmannia clavigera kw1407]EFX01277.1 hypothetical protein CMQ_6219 [Grosmannia clavigera kw1407]